MIDAGTILLHRQFQFADGAQADKYLVALGGTPSTVVVVKTTSKGFRYRLDHGCQAGNRFPAFLLTQGCCCFPLSTWVCLGDFYELSKSDLLTKMFAGDVYKFGVLAPELTRDLQACAISCDDVSINQERIIRSSLISI